MSEPKTQWNTQFFNPERLADELGLITETRAYRNTQATWGIPK